MTHAEILKDLNKMLHDCCFNGDGPNDSLCTTTRCVLSKSDELAQRLQLLAVKLSTENK